MIEIQSPKQIPNNGIRIFLAGSIENGAAINWQRDFINALSEYDVILLNPRRDDWDASWKQDISHQPFTEQVNWEIDGLNAADIVFMYFDPSTKSPITLLELGLICGYSGLDDMLSIVCCPDGFWRKGNVQVMCQRFGLRLYNDITDATNHVIDVVQRKIANRDNPDTEFLATFEAIVSKRISDGTWA